MKVTNEILIKSLRTYVQNPEKRSVNSLGACYFRHPEDGRPCAIGQFLSDEEATEESTYEDLGDEVKDRFESNELAITVQSLHDISMYWEEAGASNAFWLAIESLCEEFGFDFKKVKTYLTTKVEPSPLSLLAK